MLFIHPQSNPIQSNLDSFPSSLTMDLVQYSSLLLALSLFLTYYYFIQNHKRHKKSSSSSNLPPGPRPLPIFGNLLQLGNAPHRSLTGLARSFGPIVSLKLGRITTILISSPEMAKQALTEHDKSLCLRFVPNAVQVLNHHNVSVIWMSPSSHPNWKTLRTVIKTHLLSQQKLDSYVHLRKLKIQQLIQHLRRKAAGLRSVKLGQSAFDTLLNLISTTCFSVNLVDLECSVDSGQEFKDLVWGIIEEVGRPNLADYFPMLKLIDPHGRRHRFKECLEKLFQIFDQMIDSRLQSLSHGNSTNDLLDELLKLELDRLSIKSLFADTFVAGTDPTSTTVEWAMAELLRNPDQMAYARAELDEVIGRGKEVEESDISRLPFLQAIVKETFRLHPAAPLLLPHKAETSIELSGYTVPKCSKLIVNVWGMGRDPDLWENPEVFKPERFLGSNVDFRGGYFEMIPFGSGRRMCPGMPLASRMVHLMLASLIHEFEWRLPDGMKPGDMDMSDKFGVNLALSAPLQAIPVPRKEY